MSRSQRFVEVCEVFLYYSRLSPHHHLAAFVLLTAAVAHRLHNDGIRLLHLTQLLLALPIALTVAYYFK